METLAVLAASSAATGSMATAASAAAGIGGAAAAGAGAAAGGFSLFQALSIGAPLLGAVFDVAAANQESAFLKSEAEFERFNTTNQQIENQRESNDSLDVFLDTLAEQNVAFSGNGIDLAFGTPAAAAADAADTSARELDNFRRRGEVIGLTGRARARSLLIQARQARIGGIGKAIGGIAKAGIAAAA